MDEDLCVDEDLLVLLRSYVNRPALLLKRLAECSRAELVSILPEQERAAARHLAERDARWLEQPGHDLVFFHDAAYPEVLKEIDDPPAALWMIGDRRRLADLSFNVAIVGSRKASQYGRHQALQLATELCRQGAIVTSGLALGIDAAAHEGALVAEGVTLAVLRSGCDEVYPRRHWRLAERIRETGLILSEFPTGTQAYPENFPRRNRIVTGLSQGVVVVEAGLRSGSLVSARLALSQGREVMAVPGPVTQANARGCHQLIKDGAALVESSEDVLRSLGRLEDALLSCGSVNCDLSPEEHTLLAELSRNPSSIDELVSVLGQAVDEVTVNLVSLEVMGHIFSEGGIYHASTTAVESSGLKS